MKERLGFIANSSSSSFIILGTDKLKTKAIAKLFECKEEDELWEVLDKQGYRMIDESDIVGYLMGSPSEGEVEELSVSEIVEKSKEVAEKLGIPIETVKLFSGTEYN